MAQRVGEPVGSRAGADSAGRTLALLRRGPGMTVSELAAGQGVARSTVQARLDLLRRHGLVRHRSAVARGRGRPAGTVEFDPGAARVLAAHVGLTGSRVAVTDLAGTVLADRFVDVAAASAPVLLDLDVNLLGLAERRRSWPDHEVFVCVKLGTLIDAAIVVNGSPVHGVDGRAGELGHVKVGGATEPCSCGGIGCLDAVASGSAVVRQLSAAGEEVDHVSQVVALAREGHPAAVRAVRAAGRHIGTALASVVNLLNPGVITVWGYLADAEATLFAGIREGLYQAALPSSSESLVLVRTSLGELTGVRGAAAMVIDQVLAPAAVDRMLVGGSWLSAGPDRT